MPNNSFEETIELFKKMNDEQRKIFILSVKQFLQDEESFPVAQE